MRIISTLIILWVFVLISGCQANFVDAEAPLEITPSPVTESHSTPVSVSPTQGVPLLTPTLPIPADAGLQNLIDKAIADLAQRLSITVPEITLVEVTPVVWPDASLGCPQPGMAYTQVQQDGLLIRLQADRQIYEYHSGGSRDPFLCIKNVKDLDPPPQIDIFNLTPKPKSTPDSSSTPDNSVPSGEDQ